MQEGMDEKREQINETFINKSRLYQKRVFLYQFISLDLV